LYSPEQVTYYVQGEVALQLALAATQRLPIARRGAFPKSTADAVGQLYAEVLYKVAHAIDDTEDGQTESGCLTSIHGYLPQGTRDMGIVVFCIAGQSTAAYRA
jgi:hypothetical protein